MATTEATDIVDNLSSDEESNDDKENDVRLIDLSVLRHVIGHSIKEMEMRYFGRESLTNNTNLVLFYLSTTIGLGSLGVHLECFRPRNHHYQFHWIETIRLVSLNHPPCRST